MIVLSEACRTYGLSFCTGNPRAAVVWKWGIICISAEAEVYLLMLKKLDSWGQLIVPLGSWQSFSESPQPARSFWVVNEFLGREALKNQWNLPANFRFGVMKWR